MTFPTLQPHISLTSVAGRDARAPCLQHNFLHQAGWCTHKLPTGFL